MFKLFKTKGHIYNDCSIPAELFFKIIETDDYTLVGDGTPEKQQAAFWRIYDEYIELTDNTEILNLYEKQHELNVKVATINAIAQCLDTLLLFPKAARQIVGIINSYDVVTQKLNPEKRGIFNEIKRLERLLGRLRNEAKYTESQMPKNKQEAVKNAYQRNLSWCCTVLGYYMPDNITLKRFIAEIENAKIRSKNGK